MQMFGRAGRPQYDTQGMGIIITSEHSYHSLPRQFTCCQLLHDQLVSAELLIAWGLCTLTYKHCLKMFGDVSHRAWVSSSQVSIASTLCNGNPHVVKCSKTSLCQCKPAEMLMIALVWYAHWLTSSQCLKMCGSARGSAVFWQPRLTCICCNCMIAPAC